MLSLYINFPCKWTRLNKKCQEAYNSVMAESFKWLLRDGMTVHVKIIILGGSDRVVMSFYIIRASN